MFWAHYWTLVEPKVYPILTTYYPRVQLLFLLFLSKRKTRLKMGVYYKQKYVTQRGSCLEMFSSGSLYQKRPFTVKCPIELRIEMILFASKILTCREGKTFLAFMTMTLQGKHHTVRSSSQDCYITVTRIFPHWPMEQI